MADFGPNLGSRAGHPATVAAFSRLFNLAFTGAQGSLLYHGATSWATLPPGTAGQVLGAGTAPQWVLGAALEHHSFLGGL